MKYILSFCEHLKWTPNISAYSAEPLWLNRSFIMREHLSEHKGWNRTCLRQDRHEACLSHRVGFIFKRRKALQTKHLSYLKKKRKNKNKQENCRQLLSKERIVLTAAMIDFPGTNLVKSTLTFQDKKEPFWIKVKQTPLDNWSNPEVVSHLSRLCQRQPNLGSFYSTLFWDGLDLKYLLLKHIKTKKENIILKKTSVSISKLVGKLNSGASTHN